MKTLRRRYGGSPGHLLLMLASFALAGFAVLSLIRSRPIEVAVWFVGAAVVHDFVLLPLYTLADHRLRRAAAGRAVAWLNYVRFPAAISLLLLIVFLPSIARLSGGYTDTTALSSAGYLWRWLAITAGLFVISAGAYALRLLREARRR
jgi:hypothetical protein